ADCSPDGAISVFTRVFDALWRNPGQQGRKAKPSRISRSEMRATARTPALRRMTAHAVKLACVLAMFAATSPAAAQNWKKYTYSAQGFSVAFPAEPKIETMTYPAPGGRIVDARVYSVAQAASLLRMTVVDLTGAPVEDTSAIDHAVTALVRGNEVKVDVP